ncbi:MAG: 3-carboxy-cis,cis-muconate cycloisomerase [Chloroflexi bacterium OHK40]
MSEALYSTPALAAIFAPEAHVAKILAFEAALARAEARAGVIPPDAAEAIGAACQVERFDVHALYRDAARAGTLAIPLVRALTAQVAEPGRAYVHWGATSQDAIDTALMLQLREALPLIEADLLRLAGACATLADAYRHTLLPARTLLQQALPIPFGLKAARWLGLAVRQARAIRAQWAGLWIQFGGAAGTLAALGDRGLAVAAFLAEELGLAVPDLPWHAERDHTAALAATLGVAAGAMAKIAHDIVLLAQTEVGEVSEAAAPGKGGSSAMPQKRNPVDAVLAQAAARLAQAQVGVILGAMAHEHERAAGGWQAEWQALPDLLRFAGGAVARVADAVSGLELDAARMRANLDAGGGLMLAESLTMALAPHLGRAEAQHLVQALCGRAVAGAATLRDVALADPQVRAVLSPEAIAVALDPAAYLGSASAMIDRALEGYHILLAERR